MRSLSFLIMFFMIIFECKGCELVANIVPDMQKTAYDRALIYSDLSIHSYFFKPFLKEQMKEEKEKTYRLFSEEEKTFERRNGMAIGLSLGQLKITEMNILNLSSLFRETLQKQTKFFKDSYWISQNDAEKLAIAISDDISWNDGISLLKSVYGASEYAIQIKSFEDALFTVFLRIERPPEKLSFWSRFSSDREEKQRELDNNKELFIAYMNAAIKYCEEKIGCTDSDLEKIYRENVLSPKEKGNEKKDK